MGNEFFYGMEINVEKKTKLMRISRQPFPVKIMIDQKQLQKVESFKYLGSILTNDGRCTCEIKCRIAMAKAAFNKMRALFTSTLDSELRMKLAAATLKPKPTQHNSLDRLQIRK
jgi:hypothetical protein